MAALTGNYDANEKAGRVQGYNLGASKTVFKGALVASDDATGWAEPAADTAGKTFLGVAYEPGDNAGGAAGAVGLRVQKAGSFIYNLSGTWDQTVIGKKAYAVDDNTVALAATTTNDLYVGDIVGLAGTSQVRVRIDRAAG